MVFVRELFAWFSGWKFLVDVCGTLVSVVNCIGLIELLTLFIVASNLMFIGRTFSFFSGEEEDWLGFSEIERKCTEQKNREWKIKKGEEKWKFVDAICFNFFSDLFSSFSNTKNCLSSCCINFSSILVTYEHTFTLCFGVLVDEFSIMHKLVWFKPYKGR